MERYEVKNGLTLVEMLVTMAIIAVLATMVIAISGRISSQAKEKTLENAFTLLEAALQEYYDYWKAFPDPNKPSYPTHSAALYEQLQSTPSSRKILEHVDRSMVKNVPGTTNILQIYDSWGIFLDYKYVPGDTFPELISAGPDRKFATVDDISSRK